MSDVLDRPAWWVEPSTPLLDAQLVELVRTYGPDRVRARLSRIRSEMIRRGELR